MKSLKKFPSILSCGWTPDKYKFHFLGPILFLLEFSFPPDFPDILAILQLAETRLKSCAPHYDSVSASQPERHWPLTTWTHRSYTDTQTLLHGHTDRRPCHSETQEIYLVQSQFPSCLRRNIFLLHIQKLKELPKHSTDHQNMSFLQHAISAECVF